MAAYEDSKASHALEAKSGQAGAPSGLAGIVTGMLMRWLNAEMNRIAALIVAPESGERVLDIGFGPGHLIEMLAERRPALVAGIDHSATMLERAQRRNAHALKEGRIELKLGSVARMPWPDGNFDKIVAVNSFQFWPDPARDLLEVRRALKPGGLLLIVIRGRKAKSNSKFAGADRGEQYLARALEQLPLARFVDIAHETRDAWPYPAICVRARKPITDAR
jgi:ubiquinone/menaquinone biosynthesis C-methylase UbiE